MRPLTANPPMPASHKRIIGLSIVLWLTCIPALLLMVWSNKAIGAVYTGPDGSTWAINNVMYETSSVLLCVLAISAFLASFYCGCCLCCTNLTRESAHVLATHEGELMMAGP